jgi:hypothetical protein
MDSLMLMGKSLCRADPNVSIHFTVPDAPESLRSWASLKPRISLSTQRLCGAGGWDIKARLLLQELAEGAPQALWLDADMIVTRAVCPILRDFPPDWLIVAEEWDQPPYIPVAHFWQFTAGRPVLPVNSCFVRALPVHRPLLEAWARLTGDARYREAQKLPFERRPFHLASDQVLLTALLSNREFANVPFGYIRIGRHIAQCAGSSGYRPWHRLLDLFRGLPPLIHAVGRKPWQEPGDVRGVHRFLIDLTDDISPYVLAARPLAQELQIHPAWLEPRTAAGSILRTLSAGHPALAGLPVSILHTAQQWAGRASARRHAESLRGTPQY